MSRGRLSSSQPVREFISGSDRIVFHDGRRLTFTTCGVVVDDVLALPTIAIAIWAAFTGHPRCVDGAVVGDVVVISARDNVAGARFAMGGCRREEAGLSVRLMLEAPGLLVGAALEGVALTAVHRQSVHVGVEPGNRPF
jgi:hypothetical protein